jgi:hypothetical protein
MRNHRSGKEPCWMWRGARGVLGTVTLRFSSFSKVTISTNMVSPCTGVGHYCSLLGPRILQVIVLGYVLICHAWSPNTDNVTGVLTWVKWWRPLKTFPRFWQSFKLGYRRSGGSIVSHCQCSSRVAEDRAFSLQRSSRSGYGGVMRFSPSA